VAIGRLLGANYRPVPYWCISTISTTALVSVTKGCQLLNMSTLVFTAHMLIQ